MERRRVENLGVHGPSASVGLILKEPLLKLFPNFGASPFFGLRMCILNYSWELRGAIEDRSESLAAFGVVCLLQFMSLHLLAFYYLMQ